MLAAHIKHNFIKNALIIILAIILEPVFFASIQPIKVEQMGNFLLIISILLVSACFANFAFTYEKSNLKIPAVRLIAHSATFTFMLLIALLLECLVLAVQVVYPSFYSIIFALALLLYTGVILYDFWDLYRRDL